MSKTDITSDKDQSLIARLKQFENNDKDYWSFRGRSNRVGAHALFSYPAMMVPQMQGILLDAILSVDSEVKTVFDPFVGVGTTLGESMARGLNFIGHDVNPLAILACQVKSQPLYIPSLEKKIVELNQRLRRDEKTTIEVDFNGKDKWFLTAIQIELSRLKRAIEEERSIWARRFFWLTLCSTVRTTCNSRSSTYKLHVKKLEDIRYINAQDVFNRELEKNLRNLKGMSQKLQTQNLLSIGRYTGNISLELIDSKRTSVEPQVDLIISSPPYGDNKTTVPYGQFSYLPLQWINLSDISKEIQPSILQTQSMIDNFSLGGKLKYDSNIEESLSKCSRTFKDCLCKVRQIQGEEKKIVSFISDFYQSLVKITGKLKNDGYMIWVVGNRRVGGVEIPFNVILRELLESLGCNYVYEIQREIPSKRMAAKNKTTTTMTREFVLIMKKVKLS